MKFNPLIFNGFDNSGSTGGGGSPSGPAGGDLSGTYPNPSVAFVGGTSASVIVTGVNLANNSTSSNTPNTIVRRDSSGNFSAGTITANLIGNVSGNATNVTGIVAVVNGGTGLATLTANSVILGNGTSSPLFVAPGISGNVLTSNGTTWISSASGGSGITQLTGDVTAGPGSGSQVATVVSVGGSSASAINSATLAANSATSANTPNTIVKRDVSGNFSAGTITASLTGNVTGNVSGSAASFTGSLLGDVTGTQGSTVVSFVGGSSASAVNTATLAANSATNLSTPSTIMKRDASGATHLKGLQLDGTTSGSISIVTPASVTSYTLTLPSLQGSASTVLSNDGSGNLSWATSGSTSPGGANTNVQFNDSGVFGGTSGLVFDKTNVRLGINQATPKARLHANSSTTSGTVGTDAIILGNVHTTTAIGDGALIIGGFGGANKAQGVDSFASGRDNTSSGIVSTTFGDSNIASGIRAFSIGDTNTASGTNSFTAGSTNIASSTYCFAFGVNNTASGVGTTVFGAVNTASLDYAFATGSSTLASGVVSSSFGQGTTAQAWAQVAIGNYNVVQGTPGSIVSGDEAFIIGNGTSNGSRHNSFSVTNNGIMKIYGTTSGSVSIKVPATTTSHTLTLPSSQGSASTVLTNDGSGNLSWSASSGGITQLTGDVTAGPGSGSQAATVAFVGGSSASLIATGAGLANAATSSNSASTIVRRDSSGSFSASTIVATGIQTQFQYYTQGANQALSAGFIISPTDTFITVTTGGASISNTSTPISAGSKSGQLLIIRAGPGAADITLKAGGNVDLPSGIDYVLTNAGTITLIWHDAFARWTTLAVSAN